MKQGASNRKVNEQAREVIASIMLFEISDPRLHLVTITGCEVSYDRSACNVFYTTEPERYEEVEAAFAAARGRIRSLMAKKLSWRVAPELRFHLDRSVDEAESIAYALDRDRERNLGAAEAEAAEAEAGAGAGAAGDDAAAAAGE
ncbi:30S ribosome-binding factor RbfA [Adlercreutzia sp. ZJ473]|uniref:30S ribosome-binding factor RbfA n=1 Tax=Adlercreutzia sp. ZJ473 TaxID=2722822 RepID=UPI00155489A7